MSFHQFSFYKVCVYGISAIWFLSEDLACYTMLKTNNGFISLLWQDHHPLLWRTSKAGFKDVDLGSFCARLARVSFQEFSIKSKFTDIQLKSLHCPHNAVKYILPVQKSCLGETAGLDDDFHSVVDSSLSKLFIILSYLIDHPKCSLNNCLVAVESSHWDNHHSVRFLLIREYCLKQKDLN